MFYHCCNKGFYSGRNLTTKFVTWSLSLSPTRANYVRTVKKKKTENSNKAPQHWFITLFFLRFHSQAVQPWRVTEFVFVCKSRGWERETVQERAWERRRTWLLYRAALFVIEKAAAKHFQGVVANGIRGSVLSRGLAAPPANSSSCSCLNQPTCFSLGMYVCLNSGRKMKNFN